MIRRMPAQCTSMYVHSVRVEGQVQQSHGILGLANAIVAQTAMVLHTLMSDYQQWLSVPLHLHDDRLQPGDDV